MVILYMNKVYDFKIGVFVYNKWLKVFYRLNRFINEFRLIIYWINEYNFKIINFFWFVYVF